MSRAALALASHGRPKKWMCALHALPGSVKYERSWGVEESLEQFQCLMRQHLAGERR